MDKWVVYQDQREIAIKGIFSTRQSACSFALKVFPDKNFKIVSLLKLLELFYFHNLKG